MSGSWGKGLNPAVTAAPPPGAMQREQSGSSQRGGGGGGGNRRGNQNRRGGGQQNNSDNTDGRGGGRGGGGGGRGGRGGGRGGGGGGGGRDRGGGRGNKNSNQNNGQKSERINIRDVQLVSAGMGSTPSQKAVIRIDARQFVAARLKYVEPCVEFSPHSACHWTDDDRLAQIQAVCSRAMELGDVSKQNPKETAPPLEECKPLEVNEDTRWKSKVFSPGDDDAQEENPAAGETTEEIVAKARVILNKISWTTLEKLTVKFMEETQLETNAETRRACIELLVHKAQTEHHFGAMYAQLCATIGKQVKAFKKDLLTQCQKEFEIDTAHKIEQANQGVENPDEQEYNATLIRKSYIGHMKFLGELYLRDVVKLAIMMYCLDELLKDEEHEESIECFANLMTIMGEKLDTHAKQNQKPFDWGRVIQLRQHGNISARTKFLLQDLLELKDRSWITRRKEEKAMHIDEIKKEVAKEEQQAKMNRRVSSSQNLRRSSSMASAPSIIDEDGFTQINRSSIRNVGSKNSLNNLEEMAEGSTSKKAPPLRRSQSQPASMSSYTVGASPSPYSKRTIKNIDLPTAPEMPVLSPDECSKKIKNLLKEYFVGGDTDDAVLTVHEMIGDIKDGVERGAKVIEGGTLMVMEMKEQDTDKLLEVIKRLYKENDISGESIEKGLKDPLEFLSDVEIDAPLAGNHLAKCVAAYVELGAIQFDFLKDAPDYFKTDGKPAAFGIKVLKAKGGDPSEADLQVVESLMTEDDKKNLASAQAMYDA